MEGLIYLTELLLVPAAAAGRRRRDVAADELVQLFWAQIEPADGVEHIRARCSADRLEVVLFLVGTEPRLPDALARRIAERVLDRSPALASWRLAAPAESSTRGSVVWKRES